MKKDQSLSWNKTGLRRRAETVIKQRVLHRNPLLSNVSEALWLIRELQVHQLELELRNQVLQETRQQLEQRLKRYTDLYDSAPVGYATLARDGTIREINLAGATFLGLERTRLIGQRLASFISTDTCPIFNAFFDKLRVNVTKESCEVALARDGAPPCHLQLEGIGGASGKGNGCRIAMVDISARKHMEHLAYHDALTLLPNRFLLVDRLQQAMAQVQRDNKRLAICCLDLDNFKPINDTYGHKWGDQVLIEVAQRLKECVRTGDTVARLGGDEFILLLGELTGIEECEQVIVRVLTALQAPFIVIDQPVQLKASLGITLYPDDNADPDTLLRHVDQAMYAAKQAGGHRYRWFDTGLDHRARDYRALLQEIRSGLESKEFRLYYQPKVDMRRGVVTGAEALIYWQHPQKGLLSPARFISAIDTSELACAVGRWVLNEALRQMTVWVAHGLHLPVSINLSGHYFLQADFITQLRTLLANYPTVPPDNLELEILETAILENMTEVSSLITGCQELGVSFALDDFGTGYSSLTYLKHLPVNLLKIDQSFVRDMLADADALAIVKGVIGLSAAFRCKVIAEGVETVEHGRQLLDLGCEFAQGYAIARPMLPEQIPGWVSGWASPDEWAV